MFIVKCYNGLACINKNRLIKINDYFTRIDYKSLRCFNKNTQCQQYLTTINGTLYYILNFFCKFHFSLLPPISLMLSNCSPIPGNIVWREKEAFKFPGRGWGSGGVRTTFATYHNWRNFYFFTSFSLKAGLTDTCIVHNRYSRLACASI